MSNKHGRLIEVLSTSKLKELAQETGINYHTLRTYVLGRSKPSVENFQKIADVYGVSMDWLAGRKGAVKAFCFEEPKIKAASSQTGGFVAVSFLDLDAKADSPKQAEQEDAEPWLWISRKWAERFGQSNLSIFKATSNSMIPMIEPGDLLLLNRADKSRGPGIRLVCLDDSLVVNRCEPLPSHAMLINSDNKDYESYTVKKGNYKIVGAVVAVIKTVE